MTTRVKIVQGAPTPTQALKLHREIFPEPGEYVLKAAEPEAEEEFEEWFLKTLHDVTLGNAMSLRDAMWDVLERLFAERGYQAPSQMDFWELHGLLNDLSHASTARMVGLRIPPDLLHRLGTYGFTAPEALDFPALAYRMGLAYKTLKTTRPVAFDELRRVVSEIPLTPAERSAVEIARLHAGVYMRPIFDEVGNVWTADRELPVVREAISRAIETRQGRAETAREIGRTQRAQGIIRNSRRLARTEIANATNAGQWAENERQGLTPDDLMFRQTSAMACKDCLRLFKNPDGTPKLYTRAEIAASDQLGPNRGPREEWTVKIGAIHPNCVCAPWMKYNAAMAPLFARRAPEFAAEMRRRGVAPAEGATA